MEGDSMQDQETTATAICLVGVRHDRCSGTIRHLYSDEVCGCTCHSPAPDQDQDLEQIQDLEADRLLENEWVGAEL
jgi:hypothetical protein